MFQKKERKQKAKQADAGRQATSASSCGVTGGRAPSAGTPGPGHGQRNLAGLRKPHRRNRAGANDKGRHMKGSPHLHCAPIKN